MRAAAAAGILLLAAAPGAAQGTFVGGLGGWTFADGTSGPLVAAQVGVPLGGRLTVIGEAGRMQNVLPSEVQRQLDLIGRVVALDGGADVAIDGRLTAMYGLGGVRWRWRPQAWSPFVEGGAGVARLRLRLEARGRDDSFTQTIEKDLLDDDADNKATKAMVVAGGGITLAAARRLSVDTGYRYSRIFTSDPGINVHAVYASVRFHF